MKLTAVEHVHVDGLDETFKWYKDILYFEVAPKLKF